MEDYFIEENKGVEISILSPSVRFKLVISNYKTSPGSWNYSRGIVYRIEDNKEIADIKRNYSFNNYNWVKKNNVEYLISVRSYMGQTIVNLETGEEFNDPKWPDKYEGNEFCWAKAYLSPDGNTLAVDGCHWACPYEYKFYDFTSPEMGWPELELKTEEDEYPYADVFEPFWKEDGTVELYEGEDYFKPLEKRKNDIDYDLITGELEEKYNDSNGENPKFWSKIVDIRRKFKREGNKIVLVEKWISDYKLSERKEIKEHNEKFDKVVNDFKENNPLRKVLIETVNNNGLFVEHSG